MIFRKNNINKTAFMRPFDRLLNIENRCRNKEMASYFAKMTFFVKFPVRPGINLLILKNVGDKFLISAPIFKFKVSMERSHQCRFITVILLKIDGAVLEILMKNH